MKNTKEIQWEVRQGEWLEIWTCGDHPYCVAADIQNSGEADLLASAPTLKADNERLTGQAAQLRDALKGVTKENEGLRESLSEIVNHAQKYGGAPLSAVKMYDRARAALGRPGDCCLVAPQIDGGKECPHEPGSHPLTKPGSCCLATGQEGGEK